MILPATAEKNRGLCAPCAKIKNKDKETHYVWVIHGTWNACEGSEQKWYLLDSENPANFCLRLSNSLTGKPLV